MTTDSGEGRGVKGSASTSSPLGADFVGAEICRIINDVRKRDPGEVEGAEAIFKAAIEELSRQGGELISGSFGFNLRADPLAAVARMHTLYKSSGGALFLACEVLGWNHDQAWAFCEGFDREETRVQSAEVQKGPPGPGPGEGDLDRPSRPSVYADPRAAKHPACVALGRKLRAELLPVKR